MSTLSGTLAAERRFLPVDQDRFAALSGDLNPVHVDPVAARRTPAGAAVVHGLHGLLWSLDVIATGGPWREPSGIDADFAQFLYVGETASLHIVRRTERECRAELRVGETVVAQHVVTFGGPAVQDPRRPLAGSVRFGATQREPLDLDDEATAHAGGEVEYFCPDDAARSAFPALAAAIGDRRVTALLALTRLVGMVSPGLHSTFHRLSVKLADMAPSGRLLFQTIGADPRFGVFTTQVSADGIFGQVRTSRRRPPTLQPNMAAVRDLVPRGCFAGRSALVIGGSRGLGEVTAKLLAAGGASVAITYASGADDAARVVGELRSDDCTAQALRFEASEEPDGQLAALTMIPDTAYYFATPRISGRNASRFDNARFRALARIYVDGFDACAQALAKGRTRTIRMFYPSTIFVERPTRHMVEYAMAKAAGEVLCADLSRFDSRLDIVVRRLERLGTDQTASMIEQDVASAPAVMAPIVLDVELGRR